MIVRLVKVAVSLGILYALWNTGQAYWQNYRFQDALSQAALFGGRIPESQIQDRVLTIASTMEIPVRPEEIRVTREADVLVIEATYTRRIELLPTYHYPYRFTARGSAPVLP